MTDKIIDETLARAVLSNIPEDRWIELYNGISSKPVIESYEALIMEIITGQWIVDKKINETSLGLN